MSSSADITLPAAQERVAEEYGPHLNGAWQKVSIAVWAVIFLFSLISFALSIVSLNIWDRVPAANLTQYFPEMTQEAIDSRVAFQNEVVRMGFTLSTFAFLLSSVRVIGSLALFVLSGIIVRRYPRQLMAVLLAVLLAVMGAAGMWNNPLFSWATALVPWMKIPTQVLSVLLWFGVIVLFSFPDGRFTPRWTVWLVILLVPISFSLAFSIPIFLNPDTWPGVLSLLPNLVFIGLAFFSVIYRFAHTADPAKKTRLKGYTVGVALLMPLYFILFFVNEFFPALTGQELIQGTPAILIYILISEPLWFVLELVFALGAGRSIVRDRLMQA